MKKFEDMSYEELLEVEAKIKQLKKDRTFYKGEMPFECVDILRQSLMDSDLEPLTRKDVCRNFHKNLATILDMSVGNYEIRPRLGIKDKTKKYYLRRNGFVTDKNTEAYKAMHKELDELVMKYMQKGANNETV